jgi:tRNA-Thr(GGU) m(6)t(6)A37 methyltransferase TsaA
MRISYRSIGVIHSPFHTIEGMPIQPAGAAGVEGSVEVWQEFAAGLQDLEGFSHIILLYHFHQVKETRMIVTPFMDTRPRGVFATRAPKRPNPIGLSVVRLVGRDDNVLHIENVDILDGTPLLDLKPYVPAFNPPGGYRTGWLETASAQVREKRSDDRFR